MPVPSYRDKELAAFYFRPVVGADGRPSLTKFRCRCGQELKQQRKSGHGNLAAHVRAKHPDHDEFIHSEGQKQANALFGAVCVTEKARNIFGWMDLTVNKFLPFCFVDDETFRLYSRLQPTTSKTMLKYYSAVGTKVEEAIAAELPEHFGIMFDGWSDGSGSHYVAVFAEYSSSKDGSLRRPLLS